jgi:hypothetical protein
MDPNGKSVNPPIIGGVPKQVEGMRNERVAPAESAGQQPTPVVQSNGTSEEVKTIVTILLLIFVYPIGAIVAILWPKWRWWVKLLVSLPMILGFVLITLGFALLAMNPSAQLEKAKYISECAKTYSQEECAQKYIQMQLAEPSITLPSVE